MTNIREIGYKIALDDAEFRRNLARANKEMGGFKKNLTGVGDAFSKLGLGLSFLSAGVGKLGFDAIQAASAAEEAGSKFNVVFRDQADAVRAWAEENAVAINRSSADWIEYLGTIQDTFVPLGFARDQAADMAKQVVLLSEDLASFNNLPTADVVRDIQSALVGNTETLRKYGVVAQEAQIIQEAINSGLVSSKQEYNALDGEQRSLTRTQAIYNLILKGTTDAQGDAERTSESFANQVKGLQSSAKELSIELGEQLLPAATNLIDGLRSGIEDFRALDESTQNLIIRATGLTAALGPLSLAIGGVSKALLFLAANPIVAVVGGIAALGVGTATLVKHFEDVRSANFKDEFGEIAESSNIAAAEIFGVVDALSRVGAGDLDTARRQVELFATDLQTSRQNIVEIGLASEDLNDEQKELLKTVQAELETQEKINDEMDGMAEKARLIEAQYDEIVTHAINFETATISTTDYLQAGLEATRERRRQQQMVNDLMLQATELDERAVELDRLAGRGIFTEIELLERKKSLREAAILAAEDEIAAIQAQAEETGNATATQQQAISTLRQLINDQVSDIERYEMRMEDISESAKETEASTEKTYASMAMLNSVMGSLEDHLEAFRSIQQQRNDLEDDYAQKLENQLLTRLEQIYRERDEALAAAETLGAEKANILLYYDNLIDAERERLAQEERKRQLNTFSQITGYARDFYNTLTSLSDAYYGLQLQLLDNELERELQRRGLAEESEEERLERELERIRQQLEETTDAKERERLQDQEAELERELAKERIRERFAEKERELLRDQAKLDKQLGLFDIAINTASAIVKALTAGPIVGPILAGIIGSLGAAQAAIVANTPIPEFAEGGVVNQATQAIVGEAGAEAIIPLRTDVLAKIGEGIAEASQTNITNNNSNGITHLHLHVLDEEQIYEVVNNGAEDGKIRRLQ